MHRIFRAALTVVAAAAPAFVAIAGVPVAAGAISPVASSTPAAVRLCAEARPGYRACFAERRTDQAAHPNTVTPNALPAGYGPSQLVSAYKIPTSLGAGQTVAIVDAQDDPNAESDLANYRSTFGLSPCTTANGCFKKVNQSGNTSPLPSADAGWAGEIALDIQMVSASCPNCHILLVEANSASNADLDTAVNYAAAHAQVVSNSYGGPESSSDPLDHSYSHAGTTILASSGDEGYVVEFPAASPSVVAVGGTNLTTSTNSRGWTERVWNTSNTEGAGSGCSRYETKSSWQTDTGCTRRTVADVSAVADPATGVAVYDSYGSGGWAVYGGTSVSSPLVAGMYAESGNANGPSAAQYAYGHAGSFFDVTSGQTSSTCTSYLCRAQAGYDGPTGLGTPNGVSGLGPGTGTPTNDFSVSLSPSSGSVTSGSSVSATVSTAVTSGSAVTVSLTATAPSGITASLSPTSLTAGASATLTMATSSTLATGTYSVTVTGTSGTTTHSATYTLSATRPGGCSTTTQLFGNPGFETSGSWSATAGVLNTGGAHSRTGSGYAWLDGYGSTHTDTLSQSVTIPSSACSASLTFWMLINTAETTTSVAYDKLTVTIGGTTLATYSNLNHTSSYVQKTFDVSAFKGQTVTVKFTGTEDVSLQTSFFLDDTALNSVS